MPKRVPLNLDSGTRQSISNKKGIQEIDGKLYLNGQIYRSVGVNHYGFFLRDFREDRATKYYSTNEQDLQDLSSNGIDIIRSAFCMDNYISWLKYYHLDKNNFWKSVQKSLDDLASYNVGCICVLNWDMRMFSDSIFFSNKWIVEYPSDLFNPQKYSYNKNMEYIKEFVSRFWDHPAIYAWEITNEPVGFLGLTFAKNWNLDGTTSQYINWLNHPNGQIYPKTAKVYLENYLPYVKKMIQEIKKIDLNNRIILSGGGVSSRYMINALMNSNANTDTFEQRNGIPYTENLPLLNYMQKDFDCVCDHVYPESLDQCPEKLWTINDYIKQHKTWANVTNKSLIMEEFGASYLSGGRITTSAAEQEFFYNCMNEILESDIPLSLIWNYSGVGTTISGDQWTINDPTRIYQFNSVCETNQILKSRS